MKDFNPTKQDDRKLSCQNTAATAEHPAISMAKLFLHLGNFHEALDWCRTYLETAPMSESVQNLLHEINQKTQDMRIKQQLDLLLSLGN